MFKTVSTWTTLEDQKKSNFSRKDTRRYIEHIIMGKDGV